LICLAAVFAAGAAVAQTPAAPPATNSIIVQTTTTPAAPATAINAPAAIGQPHTCSPGTYYPPAAVALNAHGETDLSIAVKTNGYPPEALRENAEGETTLSYTIEIDGSIKNITVFKSSGNDMLDQAAIQCATNWTYKPAMRNGQPVAVPWKAKVRWAIGRVPQQADGEVVFPVAAAPAHRCAEQTAGLRVMLDFKIEPDGAVKDVTVRTATASDDVVKSLIACVSQWRFQPPMLHGQPSEIVWRAWFAPPDDATPVAGAPNVCPVRQWYPRSAARANQQGDATVAFWIKTDGTVRDPVILTSSGHDALDNAALACVAGFHYQPATQNGQPIEVPWQATVRWRVSGGW
jgi:protein TonB